MDCSSQKVFRLCDVIEQEAEDHIAEYATKKVELDTTVCTGSGYIFELAQDTNIMFSDIEFKQPTHFKENSCELFGACLVLEGKIDVVLPDEETRFTLSKDKAMFFVSHNSRCEFLYQQGWSEIYQLLCAERNDVSASG